MVIILMANNIFCKLIKLTAIFAILIFILIGKTYSNNLIADYDTSMMALPVIDASMKDFIYELAFQNSDTNNENNNSESNINNNENNGNNNNDGTEENTENNNNNNDNEIDIDEVDNNSNPVWELTGEKQYENPFRRFEIIFFASFSYLFFLNVTIIETVTQLVPADYGQGLLFERDFNKVMIFYTFASSIIFALAVAIEDLRFVYLENMPRKKKNNEGNIEIEEETESNKFSFYFAPKISFNTDGDIAFRLFMFNF